MVARYKVRQSSQAKPLISKLAGTPTWVCRYRSSMTGGKFVSRVYGFGQTPTEAYNGWKRDMDALC